MPHESINNFIESLKDCTFLHEFLFEPLDQKTRDKIVEKCIKPYIDTNLYDVICDETNNTPEDVLNQKIICNFKSNNKTEDVFNRTLIWEFKTRTFTVSKLEMNRNSSIKLNMKNINPQNLHRFIHAITIVLRSVKDEYGFKSPEHRLSMKLEEEFDQKYKEIFFTLDTSS